jgi:hypothetical protein
MDPPRNQVYRPSDMLYSIRLQFRILFFSFIVHLSNSSFTLLHLFDIEVNKGKQKKKTKIFVVCLLN